MNFEITMRYRYSCPDAEVGNDYGTTDPKECAAIDKANALTIIAMAEPGEVEIDVKVI